MRVIFGRPIEGVSHLLRKLRCAKVIAEFSTPSQKTQHVYHLPEYTKRMVAEELDHFSRLQNHSDIFKESILFFILFR